MFISFKYGWRFFVYFIKLLYLRVYNIFFFAFIRHGAKKFWPSLYTKKKKTKTKTEKKKINKPLVFWRGNNFGKHVSVVIRGDRGRCVLRGHRTTRVSRTRLLYDYCYCDGVTCRVEYIILWNICEFWKRERFASI